MSLPTTREEAYCYVFPVFVPLDLVYFRAITCTLYNIYIIQLLSDHAPTSTCTWEEFGSEKSSLLCFVKSGMCGIWYCI